MTSERRRWERRRGRPDWEAGSAALGAGASTAAACRAAGLPPALSARVAARWGGAWVDLLDDLDGARVLVMDHAPGQAPARLADRGASVTVVDDHPARCAFRRGLLGAAAAQGAVRFATATGEHAHAGGWDVIVVDGIRLGARRMRSLVGALAPGGRVVVVADNALSPLRALDRTSGRAAGPVAGVGIGWHRALTGAGLGVQQSFAVLRCSAAPVTAFDVAAPMAARSVLQAVATRVGGHRRRGLRLLERALESWPSASAAAAVVAPARLAVAASLGAPCEGARRRITGRIGYDDSVESKVLRGEPPVEIEKRYASALHAEAEATALQALADAGLQIAPRVVARPAPDRLGVSWMGTGRPLEVAALDDGELDVWVRRASALLARIQLAAGTDAGGRVLVHGDYWLGNLLHDGHRIVGVVDWATAGWGDPGADLAHLVTSLAAARPMPDDLLARLTRTSREAFAEARASAAMPAAGPAERKIPPASGVGR